MRGWGGEGGEVRGGVVRGWGGKVKGWGGVVECGRDVVAMRGRETSNDLIYQSEN